MAELSQYTAVGIPHFDVVCCDVAVPAFFERDSERSFLTEYTIDPVEALR